MATINAVKASGAGDPDNMQHVQEEDLTENEPPLTLPWNLYNTRVLDDMRNLFQQEILTDVMVAVNGQSIACHKVLLAAASRFFYLKFVTSPESLDHNLLEVEDVDFETLRSIVVFIYKGGIELTVENVKKVFLASVKLMIPELTDKCERYLQEELDRNPGISIETHRIAHMIGLNDLTKKSWKVMLDKFQTIAATDSFKEMTQAELHKYIVDEGLNVRSEDSVFQALVHWVNHDPETRKPQFENLLKDVPLSRCSLEFLRESVCGEPLMESGLCYKLLSEALLYHTSKCASSACALLQSGVPRKGSAANTLLFIGDECEILKNGNWETAFKLTVPVEKEYSACLTKDGILVTGGRSGNATNKTCYMLSLDTLKWDTIADLNVGRCTHASVPVSDEIFVLGGFNGSIADGRKRLCSVECLKITDGTWQSTIMADMPEPLSYHTAVNYKQCIYVFGGYHTQKDNHSRATFAYDTVKAEWRRKAEMPECCFNGSSVVLGDKIYIVGSNEHSCTCCMSYDPEQDDWNVHAKPQVRHSGGSTVVWNNRILLCGGKNAIIEEYDPHSNTWVSWEHTLPQAMACRGMFAVKM